MDKPEEKVFTREDFVDERSWQKYKYRVSHPKKIKKQNDTSKTQRDNEAWKRWAVINNEIE